MNSEKGQDTGGKGQKRNKPEHDNSLEEQAVFQKSKLMPRTPKKGENKEGLDMEELGRMLAELRKDIKEDITKLKTEIKEDMREIKEDLKDMKAEISQNREDMERVKDEMDRTRVKWEGERKELVNRLKMAEKKIEKAEKEKIRNNLFITGVEVDTGSEEVILREAMEGMMKKELGIEARIGKAYAVGQKGQKGIIVEMRNWGDKIKILREKRKLRGGKIFIDAELTHREREIQRQLREVAREERNKGAIVRVGYQKMEINGKIVNWDDEENRLIEVATGSARETRGVKN